jgi:hypothetical protein
MDIAQNSGEHRQLAALAAEQAEAVLFLFERACPEDDRPRLAIAAAKAWAAGSLSAGESRKAAFAAHDAARAASSPPAIAAARAAGHASATAYVPGHAKHAAAYAEKAKTAAVG